MPYLEGRRVSLEEWTARHVPTSNAPIPELDLALAPEAGQRRSRTTEAGVRRAIATAMGIEDPDDLPALDRASGEDDGRHYIPNTKRTGADTEFKTAHPDLPASNPDRPSQKPEGRRARYVRLMAEREGTSVAEAARNHPARPKKAKAAS